MNKLAIVLFYMGLTTIFFIGAQADDAAKPAAKEGDKAPAKGDDKGAPPAKPAEAAKPAAKEGDKAAPPAKPADAAKPAAKEGDKAAPPAKGDDKAKPPAKGEEPPKETAPVEDVVKIGNIIAGCDDGVILAMKEAKKKLPPDEDFSKLLLNDREKFHKMLELENELSHAAALKYYQEKLANFMKDDVCAEINRSHKWDIFFICKLPLVKYAQERGCPKIPTP